MKTFIVNPLELKTKVFTPDVVVYSHQGFVIVKGFWHKPIDQTGHEGNPNWPKQTRIPKLACRFHDYGNNIGYPNGHGHQQWMDLPADVRSIQSIDNPLAPEGITLTFRGALDTPTNGMPIRIDNGWHIVTYTYGKADEMVSAIGLGKGGSYPIPLSAIHEVGPKDALSTLGKWHKGREILWMTKSGILYLSFMQDQSEIGQVNNGNVYSMMQLHAPVFTTMIPIAERKHPVTFGETTDLCYTYQLNDMILLREFPQGTPNEKIYTAAALLAKQAGEVLIKETAILFPETDVEWDTTLTSQYFELSDLCPTLE